MCCNNQCNISNASCVILLLLSFKVCKPEILRIAGTVTDQFLQIFTTTVSAAARKSEQRLCNFRIHINFSTTCKLFSRSETLNQETQNIKIFSQKYNMTFSGGQHKHFIYKNIFSSKFYFQFFHVQFIIAIVSQKPLKSCLQILFKVWYF